MTGNPNPFTLVTGAGSGIGKSIALCCARRKMNLLLVSLPGEKLAEFAAELQSEYGISTDHLETDLALENAPLEVFNWATSGGRPVNILVNNAGIGGTSVFGDSDPSYSDRRIMVNVRALVLLTRYFLPELKKHEKAFILNMGSLSAFFAIPYKAVYSAGKAFVVSFSKALRYELKGSGVSVCVVCPNGVRTNSGTGERINAHGLKGKLTAVDVDYLAEQAVEKMLRGKFMYIPLRLNRFLLFLQKVLPASLQQRIITAEFRKEIKAPLRK